MCGVCGIVQVGGTPRPISEPMLEAMTDAPKELTQELEKPFSERVLGLPYSR